MSCGISAGATDSSIAGVGRTEKRVEASSENRRDICKHGKPIVATTFFLVSSMLHCTRADDMDQAERGAPQTMAVAILHTSQISTTATDGPYGCIHRPPENT